MIRIDKEWGFEQVICNTEHYCSKFLHVKPGFQCSLHYHTLKDETFYVLDGECTLQTACIDPFPQTLSRGQSRHIPPGLPHRFASKEGCILLETSTHHEDSDVVRIEPSGPLPLSPACPVADTTDGGGILLSERGGKENYSGMESPT